MLRKLKQQDEMLPKGDDALLDMMPKSNKTKKKVPPSFSQALKILAFLPLNSKKNITKSHYIWLFPPSLIITY